MVRKRIVNKTQEYLDSFIPDVARRDEATLLRARMLLAFSFTVGAWGPFYVAFFYFTLGLGGVALIILIAMLGVLATP